MATHSSKANSVQAAIVHQFVHDLKNKIGGLGLLMEMFLDQSPDIQAKIISQFKQGTMDALRASEVLMEDLGIDRELDITDHELVDLSAMVDRSCERLRSQAEKKDITLNVDLEKGIQVLGKEALLSKIPDQLVTNALKFCSPGDSISVQLSAEDSCCKLVVSDNGPGIPATDIPKLFKRYISHTNQPTNGESSSKRGLADAKLVANAHHASLTVQSGGKGCGSSFIFEMQLPPDAA